MQSAMTFSDVVRARRSTRGFLPQPVPHATILEVLEEAQLAPSNCNTQPWVVHLVSGAERTRLVEALLLAESEGRRSPDFPFDRAVYHGVLGERNAEQARTYHEALGVVRDDKEGRRAVYLRNWAFFGAPHVALLFMPEPADVRVAGDIGMYAENFLLSLTAHGLAGIPQTSLSMFADTIRQVLNISGKYKMLFGISFGYADESYSAHGFSLPRAPLSESVTFHE